METHLKELGDSARSTRAALEGDLLLLQKEAANIEASIKLLGAFETELGRIVAPPAHSSNGRSKQRATQKPQGRRTANKKRPSYHELLMQLADKGKPFTSRDFTEFCSKSIKKPSKGAMSQVIYQGLRTKELKSTGETKPIKIGKRMVSLKLYKAA